MLQLMLKSTFSLLGLITLAFGVHAQELRASDTTRNKFLPTGLRVATDVLSIVRSRTSDKFSGWEVNADIDFTRYYLTTDYGYWSSSFILKNGTYANEGTYFRIGPDINFLLKDPDRNMFFLGFRYGRSQFSDQARYRYTDDSFGDIEKNISNNDVTGGWKELTGGLRVKIWKWFWMGYTARFKFGLKTKGYEDLKPYDVPGYGLSVRPNYWGFNYQLFLRIPVRKQK
jgi:Domain of unknown function (DUF6048)